MSLIVAFSGEIHAGKTEAGLYLCRHYGFRMINFSDPIKLALNAMFGWTMNHWDDREWKEATIPELGFSPRRAAQLLGTEWRGMLREDLWVQILRNKIIKIPNYRICICDTRFRHEEEWLRAVGASIIEVVRTNNPLRVMTTHSSEAYKVKAMYQLHNDVENNLLYMQARLGHLMTDLLKGPPAKI